MKIRSRISGRTATSSPTVLVPDLFAGGDPEVRLVPGGVADGGELSFLTQTPDEKDVKAIERIVTPLSGKPWSSWVSASPLVPRIDEQAHLDDLERDIEKHLAHLAHVCHHPRLRLRAEEERVPVTQARRTSVRAVASLVSRPRDWEHRTLRSIRPARVLAARVEDDWDLYENRVAARLVDHLLGRVGDRIDKLRRLTEMDQEAQSFTAETHGSRWRARRLFELWGRDVRSDALTETLARTLRVLEGIQSELQGLLDTPLYRNVPRGTFVPVTLRPTNIFSSDPHYRQVAALWRAWVRHGHRPPRSRAERQADCERFGDFALLLTVQALAALSYRPEGDPPVPGDGVIALEGPFGPAALCVDDESFRLKMGATSLRLFPILSTIDPHSAPGLWQEIRQEAEGSKQATIVLLLGRPADVESAAPTAARAMAGWERPRVVLLSPWNLDCAERLGRVIRYEEVAARLATYPWHASVRADPGVPLPPWMWREGTEVAVVEPAAPHEVEAFLRSCDSREAVFRRQEREGRGSGRTLDPGLFAAIDELRRLTGRAQELGSWTTCPVCGHEARSSFESRPAANGGWNRWGFWCRCTSCSAEWGLRLCTACGRSFPVLSANGSAPVEEQDVPSPFWIDRRHGRDVWAEPCWRPEARDAFRCPRCEACPGGGCTRCSREQRGEQRENIRGAGR